MELSRRDFLKLSAATAAAWALSGCDGEGDSSNIDSSENENQRLLSYEEIVSFEVEGKGLDSNNNETENYREELINYLNSTVKLLFPDYDTSKIHYLNTQEYLDMLTQESPDTSIERELQIRRAAVATNSGQVLVWLDNESPMAGFKYRRGDPNIRDFFAFGMRLLVTHEVIHTLDTSTTNIPESLLRTNVDDTTEFKAERIVGEEVIGQIVFDGTDIITDPEEESMEGFSELSTELKNKYYTEKAGLLYGNITTYNIDAFIFVSGLVDISSDEQYMQILQNGGLANLMSVIEQNTGSSEKAHHFYRMVHQMGMATSEDEINRAIEGIFYYLNQ